MPWKLLPANMRSTKTVLLFPTLGLIALWIVICAVYSPGLTGPLVFDDFPNIVNNENVALESLDPSSLYQAAVSTGGRIFARPLASLSFAINYFQAGGFENTFWFKMTNLVIHLINSLLIFWLATLLLDRQRPGELRSNRWLALAVAAIWALHPLNANPVVYVVQRMTSLAALFSLIGLICFVLGRLQLDRAPKKGITLMTAGAAAGMALGALAKEITLLLPLYMFCIDYFFLRNPRGWPTIVRRFHMISVGVLVTIAGYYLLAHRDHLLGIYTLRDFTLEERLLTQPRVLWFYISLLLAPLPRRFSLFHDDFELSSGFLMPWTTIPALAGLIVAMSLAFVMRKRFPLAAFATFWFVFGHAMESSVIGLELVHEHRNYLPSFGPLFVVACVLPHTIQNLSRAIVARLSMVMLIGVLSFSTYVIAHSWAQENSLAEFLVTHHPRSPRAHAFLAELKLKNKKDVISAVAHFKTAGELPPREVSYLIRAAHLLAVANFEGALPRQNNPELIHRAAQLPPYVRIRQVRGGQYLALDPSILEDIRERLQTGPIHLRIAGTLGDFAQCAEDDQELCGRERETILEWHKLALANPRTNNNIRIVLMTQMTSLYVSSGQNDLALLIAKKSRELDPKATRLMMMEANIHVLLGDVTSANRLLAEIKSSNRLDEHDREQIEKLNAIAKERHP